MVSSTDFTKVECTELVEYMSLKADFPGEAQGAFLEFCDRFGKSILQKAEIYSSKFGYGPGVALELANCTFDKVWKYPTFDIKKSKYRDPEKGIIIWMSRILYTQLVKYGKEHACAAPSEEEDLALISNLDELIDHNLPDGDLESKKQLKSRLKIIEGAFAGLDEKHKIIYLTYKAYEIPGKNIPRSISTKLKDTLELTASTIRVYKKEAGEHIEQYLTKINGK
jgi:hypothetical protein